eukprot:2382001-Pleurochrysis_carterae.AAC.2
MRYICERFSRKLQQLAEKLDALQRCARHEESLYNLRPVDLHVGWQGSLQNNKFAKHARIHPLTSHIHNITHTQAR